MGTIRNETTRKPKLGYILATDSFMSGWGGADGGKSYYAIAVDTEEEGYVVLENLRNRSEMKRVRYSKNLPRLGAKDHLAVVDKKHAPLFFKAGSFNRSSSKAFRGRR